jgi:dTDP-4-amino-4,6-dideoxygalactose transaminase
MHRSFVEQQSRCVLHSQEEMLAVYEAMCANLVRTNHALAFAYARHGLIAVLVAAGLREGDEVVLSPLTCKVVPLALLSLHLKPVYVDISTGGLNLDPQRFTWRIGSATRAVLFQHTYGSPIGVEAVSRISEQKHIMMIEDCAQCLPYAGDGRPPGSWGKAAIFSNNLLKPLPAGSGGIVVTRDNELARQIRRARSELSPRGPLRELVLRAEVWFHRFVLRPAIYWPLFRLNAKFDQSYQTRPVDVEIAHEITTKAHRVSGFQMREGTRWLDRVATIAQHRRLCCVEYGNALSGIKDLDLPAAGASQPLYYFPVFVRNKERLLEEARKKNVEIIAWPKKTPIYPVECERDLLRYGYEPGTCPVAERAAATLVGLPTHGKITNEHRKRIIDLLRSMGN